MKEKTTLENVINKFLMNSRNTNAITLIALVVTVVVLLILATISVLVLGGEDGIIIQAQKAKEDTEISEEKETVGIATTHAMGKDKYGNINEEKLRKELNSLLGNGKTVVSSNGNYINVFFTESKRNYKVDSDGNIVIDDIIQVSDKYPGDITDNGKYDGTEKNPYKIFCVEDYIAFIHQTRTGDEYVGKYIELGCSLDFSNPKSYVDSTTKEFGDWNNDGYEEELIVELFKGKGIKNGDTFGGTLDGKGNELLNFFFYDEIDESDLHFGLFQKNEGTIENLTVEGNMNLDLIEIKPSTSIYIGTIAAENQHGGKIENCESNVNITIKTINEISQENSRTVYIGGITGNNQDDENIINNCKYTGKIDVELKTQQDASLLYDIYRIGGIVGENDCEIINSINKGNIIVNKIETGDDGALLSVGGIAGKNNDNGVIENCVNLGDVTAQSEYSEIRMGGISAEMEDLTTCKIKNAYNEGKIKGTSLNNTLEIGGIVGEGYGQISYTYNTGIIEGVASKNRIGAIIGCVKSYATNSKITDSIYNKIDGIFGAQGNDIEGIVPKNNFTEEEAIKTMNDNVVAHNLETDKKYEWTKIEI